MPTKKAQGQGAQRGRTLAGLIVSPSYPKDVPKIKQPIELQLAFSSQCLYNGMNKIAVGITSSFPLEILVAMKQITPRESCIEAAHATLTKELVPLYGENAERCIAI